MKEVEEIKPKSKLYTQIWAFTKFITVLGSVWLLGYYGLSVAWVGVISVFLYIWMFENHEFKLNFRHNQGVIGVSSEKVSWLSKLFVQLWPHSKENVEVFMRNQLQSSIRKTLPTSLQSFIFTTINLGAEVPEILGVEVKESDEKYIILDFELLYNSDAQIGLSIGKLDSSIEDVQVHGTLRVVLTELNTSWPFFGKMNISFVSTPTLSFRLSKAASIFNIAGFRDVIHESISDQLMRLLVLPHFLTIPINNDYQSSTAYPLPQGVLRVHVNRAKDLPKTSQTDSIDPYCVIQVGACRHQTGVIQRTDHPMWNESFEFLVNAMRNQYMEVQCIDAADSSGIGSLGSCYMNVAGLIESSGKTSWFSLDKSTGGSISITATWLELSDDITLLAEPEMVGCQWKSLALLSVGVKSASSLPRGLRSINKPSCYVKVKLAEQEKCTKVVQATNSPSWGETFYLLSYNPKQQSISCEVIDDVSSEVLGSLSLPLSELIQEQDLTAKPYKLVSRVTNVQSTLTLSVSLKVLVAKEPSPIPLPLQDFSEQVIAPLGSQSNSTSNMLPPIVAASTPLRLRKSSPQSSRGDNESTGCSDMLDFDNWSETASNGITGGATYMVISRPGATVSEIVQNADETMTSDKDELSFAHTNSGKMQITLRYSTTQQRLVVVVHQCSNLRPMKADKDVLPNPLVVLTLYSGRVKVDRKRTKYQKATLNPVFDETFEFELLKPNLENSLVELSIKNKKRLFQKGKSSMGSVLVSVSELNLSEARTAWYIVSCRESMESLNDTTQSFASRS
ncbi:extended synaptotagmin-2-like isoform X2 [Watersipora subatra]|uniref:extended synaptotagmin-2-like isoform X2 n=1 Tax=Watersipora subatra TaxID=2589382 RepID=UPI00355C6B6A